MYCSFKNVLVKFLRIIVKLKKVKKKKYLAKKEKEESNFKNKEKPEQLI